MPAPLSRFPAPRPALLRTLHAIALAAVLALAPLLAPVCTGQAAAAARGSRAQVFKGWDGGKPNSAMTAGGRRVKTKGRNPEQYRQKEDPLTQAARRQGLRIVKGREGLQFGGVAKRLSDRVMVGVGLPGVSDSRFDYPSNVQMKYEF